MSNLIGCMIVYNESQLLPMCLESITGKVDRLVIVDGRIATYPGDGIHSDDGTLDIIRDSGAELITGDSAWEDEIQMRNQYLVGEDDDWYFVIDSDEELITPLPYPDDLPSEGVSYSVVLRMLHSYNEMIHVPRLFKHRGDMRYQFAHNALYSNDNLISHHKHVPLLPSVEMIHHQIRRGKQRWDAKRVKRLACFEREKQHRLRLWK